jgi:hypothetical protein
MIMRIAALLSLLMGATGLLGYFTIAGEGPLASREARHLRAMKNRRTGPDAAAPITFAELGALPHFRPMSEYAPLEGRGVTLEGYVQGMLHSSDGDIHLEVAQAQRIPGWPSYLYATAEIPARWRSGSTRWQYERLAATFRPVGSGIHRWDQPARRVRLTGWLLYDFQYDAPRTSSAGRLTGWEVHPVTGIEVWDESAGRYVAYAR